MDNGGKASSRPSRPTLACTGDGPTRSQIRAVHRRPGAAKGTEP